MNYTITQDLLLTAARAEAQLDTKSRDKIKDFILAQQCSDGGFCGRDRQSDLYYTLFSLATLLSMGCTVEQEKISKYLESFGNGDLLDFVHLASLARCRASLPYLGLVPKFLKMTKSPLKIFAKVIARKPSPVPGGSPVLDKIEKYRSSDGGYNQTAKNAETGTAYAGFLALLAYQDLGFELPGQEALLKCIKKLKLKDGSYANDAEVESGTTTTTAAALTLLDELGSPLPPESLDCLISRSLPSGGFLAAINSPTPDLMSTATALYTLKRAKYPLDKLEEGNYAFIESLWNEDGGFAGNEFDEKSDSEYTFYALLSLGSLK